MLARNQRAFTIVELVIIILIAGILMFASTRFFDMDPFRARGFYDEALSILRYAHETAIAQRRSVYFKIDSSAEQVALCYSSSFPCTAPNQVSDAFGKTPYTITAPSGVALQATTATYFFDALGRPYNSADVIPTSTFTTQTISIIGGGQTRTITIEEESGYVH